MCEFQYFPFSKQLSRSSPSLVNLMELSYGQSWMTSGATRFGYTRPPMHRLQRIDEWIKSGNFPNAVTMGHDLEVTDRTVKADIEFMRGRFKAPMRLRA